MSHESLSPLRYHVEFYRDSIGNDPVYHIESSTPPVPFAVGDIIDPRTWEVAELPPNKIYQVTQVTHLIWKILSSHISQKLLVVMIAANREV
jgi:hypothetical protein